MAFSSLVFLYGFLPVFLACYYLAPERARNSVALIGSVLFYAWGEPVFVAVLIVVSIVVYFLSLGLGALPKTEVAARKALLTLGLLATLSVFAYFKYANFLAEQFNFYLGFIGATPLKLSPVLKIAGISFFTFQKVSYLVDVYRGVTPPAKRLRDFLLFVMLFPQLIAGPIIRYHDLADQLRHREHTLDRFLSGLWRFFLGLGRKVLIADSLGLLADNIFNANPAALSSGFAWLGLLAYAFQIYFDFAGYSDMAIGLARMMGFEFLENFRRPYTARTVTEFWRRWHISLSNFMREYLYIPLGGNRVGPVRQLANLWLVFLVSGLWHGASTNFIFWGACHGLLLTIERLIGLDRLARVPALIGRAATFFLVLLTWVPFRAENLDHAWDFFARLFAGAAATAANAGFVPADAASGRSIFVLIVAAAISFLPDGFWARFGLDFPQPQTVRAAIFRTAAAGVCLLLASAALAGQDYHPFIYNRF